jgi:hypothetical protein
MSGEVVSVESLTRQIEGAHADCEAAPARGKGLDGRSYRGGAVSALDSDMPSAADSAEFWRSVSSLCHCRNELPRLSTVLTARANAFRAAMKRGCPWGEAMRLAADATVRALVRTRLRDADREPIDGRLEGVIASLAELLSPEGLDLLIDDLKDMRDRSSAASRMGVPDADTPPCPQ